MQHQNNLNTVGCDLIVISLVLILVKAKIHPRYNLKKDFFLYPIWLMFAFFCLIAFFSALLILPNLT